MKPTHPILQVEDSNEDAFLMQYAFKRAEISTPIQVMTDGQTAIDYLSGNGEYADREKHPLPCLVLLDLKLPYKLGLEVLEWIREQPSLKFLIVIIFTSSIADADIRRAYELGANAFLVKPSDMNDLTEMCRAIKLFWLNHNTSPL